MPDEHCLFIHAALFDRPSFKVVLMLRASQRFIVWHSAAMQIAGIRKLCSWIWFPVPKEPTIIL